jgi:hypothetical protein
VFEMGMVGDDGCCLVDLLVLVLALVLGRAGKTTQQETQQCRSHHEVSC